MTSFTANGISIVRMEVNERVILEFLSNSCCFLSLDEVSETKAETELFGFEYTLMSRGKEGGREILFANRQMWSYNPCFVMINSSNKISMERNNLGTYLR